MLDLKNLVQRYDHLKVNVVFGSCREKNAHCTRSYKMIIWRLDLVNDTEVMTRRYSSYTMFRIWIIWRDSLIAILGVSIIYVLFETWIAWEPQWQDIADIISSCSIIWTREVHWSDTYCLCGDRIVSAITTIVADSIVLLLSFVNDRL